MSSLTKPALFWITRFGLFLSVMAWVVSHWWGVRFNVRCVVDHVATTENGWVISNSVPLDRLLYGRNSRVPWFQMVNRGSLLTFPADNFTTVSLLPGTEFNHSRSNAATYWSIIFRHWFVVTFFLLLYGFLKFIYRRPEAQQCEN